MRTFETSSATAWNSGLRVISAVRGRGRSTGTEATIVDGRGDITTISSASSTASSIECVTSRVVVSFSIQIRCSSMFMRRRVIASSAPNGSSSSRTVGSVTRARAMATRWRMPPDSWRARRLEPVQAHEGDQIVDGRLRHIGPCHLEGEVDVVVDASPREQGRVLERDSDLVPGPPVGRRLTVDAHGARGRHLEVGENPQRGRLSAAGGPEQGGERAHRRHMVDAVDRHELLAVESELLTDRVELEPCFLGHRGRVAQDSAAWASFRTDVST